MIAFWHNSSHPSRKHRKLPDHLGNFDSPWKTLKELRRNWNSGPSGC
ncbi:MAG: hypothetical protein KDJ22_10410 [Candidatus Competibacteraceae bacterium]|nr:hypothetical protein [Candidatus Competibacteraceae bacterium]MCP5124762.1 hypothetical protein [Gammaproteobacteria bacterium]HRX70345.1 hypothetical protein [Candidatus Competibacteraceae bacterium]